MTQFFEAVGTTLHERRQQEAYAEARRLSGGYRRSGVSAQDRRRKQQLQAVKAEKKQGQALARGRDARASRSVVYRLSAEKQRVLDDYDNGCFEEREKAFKRARLGPYRS